MPRHAEGENTVMRVLHVMAARGNGGAELYATDAMLGLQQAGPAQCAVLHPAAPGWRKCAPGAWRWIPCRCAFPSGRWPATPCAS
ncbi:hypothetical protein RAA17_06465 [Komagataeibacter rhaeticus]|nr:hypothetical protein [Komagataeibacter rhaeticus]